MTVSSIVDTGLLTPLGAYLQLRSEGRASFLLESVEQGRLGRSSLVGCGSRLVSYEEAELAGEEQAHGTRPHHDDPGGPGGVGGHGQRLFSA